MIGTPDQALLAHGKDAQGHEVLQMVTRSNPVPTCLLEYV